MQRPNTAQRAANVARIFADVADLSGPQRERALAEACGGEAELLAELQALLVAHDALGAAAQRTFILDQLDVPRALALMHEGTQKGPDETIGPYRTVRELGHGGMGRVYLAERTHGAAGEDVAVKVVRPWVLADPLAVRRFEAERQIMATLEHPGIARLLDSGVLPDGRPWFAMEYVDGLPIDTYCEASNLTSFARLSLLAEVCDVVQHAHARGIVHRDLKPANVLVTQQSRVKLLDFGIAKLLADVAGVHPQPLTRQGARPMTLEYASPEQLVGGPITAATDVCSLGIVLYRLLAGRLPYREEGIPLVAPSRRATRTRAERLGPDPVLGGDLPARLRSQVLAIVTKALRKDPEERYATAGDFAAALRRALSET